MGILKRLFPKRDDIVCISYPKSGRTWVRFALNVAGADVVFKHGGYASRDPDDLGYEFEGIKPQIFGKRNIFLHRNPLDTAVSEFYQIPNRIFNPEHPDFERMTTRLKAENKLPPTDVNEFVLHPIWGIPKICKFNAAHIDYFKDRKNAYIVRYEDLRQQPETHFVELLEFCRVKDFDIDQVLADSSFENMKKIELSASPEVRKEHKLYGMKDGDENTMKVRKGKVAGYKDELSEATIAAGREICLQYGLQVA